MSLSSSQLLNPLNFPLHGQALIEASAGTGKTFTLAFLYLRLVLQHGGEQAFSRALMPPEVLVVTFTNAATDELRSRIRDRLVEAAGLFSGEASQDALLLELKNAFPAEQHPWAAYQLRLAAEWMDESAISTIHAWCYRMLKEHAFASGSTFEQQLENNTQEWIEQAAEDYWRTFIHGLSQSALAEVLKLWSTPYHLQHELNAYYDELSLFARENLNPEELISKYQHDMRVSYQTLRETWQTQGHLENLQALFAQAEQDNAYNKKKLNRKNLTNQLSELQNWLLAKEVYAPPPSVLKKENKTLHYMTSDGVREIWVNPTKAPVDHPACLALTQLLQTLRHPPQLRPQLFAHALHWIANRYEWIKTRLNTVTHQDLLTLLDKALSSERGASLAQTIRRQFPIALVDEFQDTDPLQYRIFRRIYLDEHHDDVGFFMIGDPKQSIYAFRGADIHTYLEAKHLTQDRHYSLNTNYRSTPEVIASINQLFMRADEQPRGAFLFKTTQGNPLPYQPVEAGKKQLKGLCIDQQEQPALHIAHYDQAGDKKTSKAVKTALAKAAAQHIARLLQLGQAQRALLNDPHTGQQRPVHSGDFAVLVNSQNEANIVQKTLKDWGISSVYLSDRTHVMDTPVATELLYILKAIAHPLNEHVCRIALASPLLKLSLAELEAFNRDEWIWEKRSAEFMHYQQLWRTKGILPLIYQLIYDFKLAHELDLGSNAQRNLTDLLHLGELLHQQAQIVKGEQALLHYFENSITQIDKADDAFQKRLETDDQLVKVVTIHKSKGLEYPLVYLPFIGINDRKKQVKLPLKMRNSVNQPEIYFELDDEQLYLHQENILAEDMRKLYVALTRASLMNWIGLTGGDAFEKSALAYAFNAEEVELLGQLKDLPGFYAWDKFREVPPYQTISKTVSFAVKKMPMIRHEPWWIASFSALTLSDTLEAESPWQHTLLEDQAALTEASSTPKLDRMPVIDLDKMSIHHLPRGSQVGTFLHQLIEWIAKQHWITAEGTRLNGFSVVCEDDFQRVIERYLEQSASALDLHEWVALLTKWMVALLNVEWNFTCTPSELTQPLKLSHLSKQHYYVEMEFWFSTYGATTHALDRCVHEAILPGFKRIPLRFTQLQGMMKGFMDLVVEHQGRYYIIDWKSNRLGEQDDAYLQSNLEAAVLAHRYDIQMALYQLALHRHLRVRLADYDYDRHVGGVAYVFLRGIQSPTQGVFFKKIALEHLQRLDALFNSQPGGEEAR